jgi:protein phosphatase PTC7
VVLGTDGLFDNVYASDILQILGEFDPEKCAVAGADECRAQCTSLSRTLADRALTLSQLTAYRSPFAENAFKAGYQFTGGKVDDITVVVAIVT